MYCILEAEAKSEATEAAIKPIASASLLPLLANQIGSDISHIRGLRKLGSNAASFGVGILIDGQKDRKTERQTDRKTDRQIDRQTDRAADRYGAGEGIFQAGSR